MTYVTIHQPNFFPWVGFFKKILLSDIFILLDDAWVRSSSLSLLRRSAFLDDSGDEKVVSIPVSNREKNHRIADVRVVENKLYTRQRRFLETRFGNFVGDEAASEAVRLFFSCPDPSVGARNTETILFILKQFGWPGTVMYSSAAEVTSTGSKRIADLVRWAGGNQYLSGPGGREYLNKSDFQRLDVNLQFTNFSARDVQWPETFPGQLSILEGWRRFGIEGARQAVGLT